MYRSCLQTIPCTVRAAVHLTDEITSALWSLCNAGQMSEPLRADKTSGGSVKEETESVMLTSEN